MRKIYIVPNLVTSANMFCGFYSIVASIQSDFVVASWAIMAAAVFDLLDGRIARLAKATSEFGSEYDSMSDLISFGLAPAILLYQWALYPYGRLGWMVCFIFMLCGALRLARFNVNIGVVSKAYFQGLPIPMAAGVIATMIIFSYATGHLDEAYSGLITLITALCLAGMMVSNLPFPSFKELHWRSRSSFSYLLIGALMMILIAVRPEVTLFLLLLGYLFFSFGLMVFHALKGKGSVHKEEPLISTETK